MRVPLLDAELHNMERRGGRLYVRRALQPVFEAASTLPLVGGFSVESPFTTEVWHYLFARDTQTGATTLYVCEEWNVDTDAALFTVELGAIGERPILTCSVWQNQIVINGPTISVPQYGLVGGGLVSAQATASRNPDTTTLDLPRGHITTWGDRRPVGVANVVYMNDPGIDPRTYVAENGIPLEGSIYDLFQGPDGALYLFTSEKVYRMPPDALGKGQRVQPFIDTIPGISTTKPRNAAVSNGQVAVLQPDGLLFLDGMRRVPIQPYKGPRVYSKDVSQVDYTLAGELFATSEGFVVGFSGSAGFFLDVNLRRGFRSYVWSDQEPLNVVGTLRTRAGETLIVTETGVFGYAGVEDGHEGAKVRGVACATVDLAEDQTPVVRRVTVSADNIGQTTQVSVNGESNAGATTPAKAPDTVIGSSTWSGFEPIGDRTTRTVRHSTRQRASVIHLEAVIDGAGSLVEDALDVELTGQGTRRRDAR